MINFLFIPNKEPFGGLSMKKLLFLFLLLPSLVFAAAPSSTYTFQTGQTIQASEVQQETTNIYRYLQAGVDTYADGTIVSADITDGTIVNADISGSAAITYGKLSLGSSLLTGDITDGTIVNADISSSAAIALSKLATTPGDMSYANTRFYIGTFTRDVSTASGTQAITGVGFQPKGIISLAVIGGTSQISVGIDTDTAMGVIADQHGTTANTYTGTSTQSIVLVVSTGNDYQGNIASFDSDGFTLNWTKTGSPTGTASIFYLAFR